MKNQMRFSVNKSYSMKFKNKFSEMLCKSSLFMNAVFPTYCSKQIEN